MKIMFATGTVGRGGKERQLSVLTRGLTDRGYEIRIITNSISPDNYIMEYGINPESLSEYQAKSWLQKYRNFKRIIIKDPPDFIVAWDFVTSLFSLLVYKKADSKFINFSIQHGIRLWKLSHLIRSFICFLSPWVMANSFAGLRANNLKPGRKRMVLYNGIEDKFQKKLTNKEIQNKRHTLIPGYSRNPGVIFVTIANFVPYKDYLTVLKALAVIKEQVQFYYFIIGDGPMRLDIENKICEYELQDKVVMTGRIKNVSDFLFISDIMIHSSRGEGVSNAILEGMFAGLPVIATNVGGVPETVYPDSSLLFPYQNYRSLRDCLLKAPEVFSNFEPQSESYQRHLEKFTVKAMVSRFESFLKKVGEE